MEHECGMTQPDLVLCLDCWVAAGAAPWPAEAMSAAEHLRAVFYRQGFNDQEIVALSGSHTLGRAHKDRSGLGAPLNASRCPSVVVADCSTLMGVLALYTMSNWPPGCY